VKPITFIKPTRDLKKELLSAPFDMTVDDKKLCLQLHDLLMQIFVIDPNQRISVEDALRHPFIHP
jgi:serine/threonine protein kinase